MDSCSIHNSRLTCLWWQFPSFFKYSTSIKVSQCDLIRGFRNSSILFIFFLYCQRNPNFWNSDYFVIHITNFIVFRVYEIEERIRTPRKFKFPHFEEVNWLAAQKLKNDLSDLNSDSTLCPSHLLSGIKALLTTLKSWLPDIESRTCPPSIDPQKLVRELGKFYFGSNNLLLARR